MLKYVGREASTGEAKYATIATVSHVLDRPWVGEMGLWLNKPRQGTAVVSEGGVRLLCVPPHHFETFVALCPDFRMCAASPKLDGALTCQSPSPLPHLAATRRLASAQLDRERPINLHPSRGRPTALRPLHSPPTWQVPQQEPRTSRQVGRRRGRPDGGHHRRAGQRRGEGRHHPRRGRRAIKTLP